MCISSNIWIFFFLCNTRVLGFYHQMLHNPLGINARLCQKEAILYFFLYSFYKSTPSRHVFFLFLFCSPVALLSFQISLCFAMCFFPHLFTADCCGAFSCCAYNTSSSPPALVSARLCLSPFIRRVIFSHNSR